MAEKIVSPGVFTNEIDQSFLPAAVADIGAALIGPTLKGPAGVPTVVTSFSEFQNKFGDVFKSGSNSYQFLTSHAAENYLRHSNTLTVVRVMDGTYGPATASILTDGSTSVTSVGAASGSLPIADNNENTSIRVSGSSLSSTITFIGQAVPNTDATDDSIRFFDRGANTDEYVNNFITEFNAVTALSGFTVINSGSGAGIDVIAPSGSTGNGFVMAVGSGSAFGEFSVNTTTTQGGADSAGSSTNSFQLKTLSDGTIMNNIDSTSTTNNILLSGSKHNIRYEVSNVNNNKGTFTLAIRRGDDNIKRKQTLETFTGVSLDPNSPNYIKKVIGDTRLTLRSDGSTKFLQPSGSFPTKSNFVTVHGVKDLIDYIDENGNVRVPSASGSLPQAGSGSLNGGFGGASDGHSGFDALGNHITGHASAKPANFYENIADTNTQGFDPDTAGRGKTGYEDALDLLSNQDEYDINLILAPGIISSVHTTIASKIIDVCEDRSDCFAILDPVIYGKNIADATGQAESRDSNFAAMYWPWVKVPDNLIGVQRWVPPSTVLGGIYAFNDKVAHPWFAPAGLNRGGIDTAIEAERKLTQSNRDTLYDSNVNPIATFPGQGVTVFGQKTLQKKSSALDRINVRRLLIKVKKFIASSSRFLVFEQNTAQTRNRFLNIVNPFLDQVQSQSGLSAFRVVMDGSNNTPDTIDRNYLVGQLFLQPTRTAEFIVLDFTIQPTGASFPE